MDLSPPPDETQAPVFNAAARRGDYNPDLDFSMFASDPEIEQDSSFLPDDLVAADNARGVELREARRARTGFSAAAGPKGANNFDTPDAADSAENSQAASSSATNHGSYYTLGGGGSKKALEKSVRKAVLDAVSKGSTDLRFYTGNRINPQLTSMAKNMIADMKSPGGPLENHQHVRVIDSRQRHFEAWRMSSAILGFGVPVLLDKFDKHREEVKAAKSTAKEVLKSGRLAEKMGFPTLGAN